MIHTGLPVRHFFLPFCRPSFICWFGLLLCRRSTHDKRYSFAVAFFLPFSTLDSSFHSQPDFIPQQHRRDLAIDFCKLVSDRYVSLVSNKNFLYPFFALVSRYVRASFHEDCHPVAIQVAAHVWDMLSCYVLCLPSVAEHFDVASNSLRGQLPDLSPWTKASTYLSVYCALQSVAQSDDGLFWFWSGGSMESFLLTPTRIAHSLAFCLFGYQTTTFVTFGVLLQDEFASTEMSLLEHFQTV